MLDEVECDVQQLLDVLVLLVDRVVYDVADLRLDIHIVKRAGRLIIGTEKRYLPAIEVKPGEVCLSLRRRGVRAVSGCGRVLRVSLRSSAGYRHQHRREQKYTYRSFHGFISLYLSHSNFSTILPPATASRASRTDRRIRSRGRLCVCICQAPSEPQEARRG